MTTNIVKVLYYLPKTHTDSKEVIEIKIFLEVISYILNIGDQWK